MTTDVTILRTLTYKSKLHFGKYIGVRVETIIGMNDTPYLRWIYYNNDKITFIPEILREIYIRENEEIKKPGKNPEIGKGIDVIMGKLGGLHRLKRRQHKKKQHEINTERSIKNEEYKSHKGYLQSKNQGH